MNIKSTERKSGQTSSGVLHIRALLIVSLVLIMTLFQVLIPAFAAVGTTTFLGWWGRGSDTTGWHDPGSTETAGWMGSSDGQFYYPYGVAVDASGNVYVADTNNQRIQKFTGTGVSLGWWGKGNLTTGWHASPSVETGQWSGNGDGEFNYPYSVAADSSGNIYVADYSNHRVQKFTGSGVLLGWWGKGSSTTGWHAAPTGETGGYDGSGEGEFWYPIAVAVDALGNVYVADGDNQRVQKFDGSGNFLGWWGKGSATTGWHGTGSLETPGSTGSGDGEFNYPYGIAVDASGNVYVSDCSNDRIQKFTSSGVFLGWWGKGNLTTGWHAPGSLEYGVSGNGDGELDYPFGLNVDSSGNVWVAEVNGHRIQMFTNTGVYLGWLGKGDLTTGWHVSPSGEIAGNSGNGDGEFYFPYGVAVDASGNVYVADSDNFRIQKFSYQSLQLPTSPAVGGEVSAVDQTTVWLPIIGIVSALVLVSGVGLWIARKRRVG